MAPKPRMKAPRKRQRRRMGPKRGAEEVRTAERTAKAIELRRSGMTYREIGKAMGVDARTARRRVDAGLDELRAEATQGAERLVELELVRMDRMVEKLERSLNARDHETVARAVRELIRVSQSRRRLLGLDQPSQVRVEGRVEAFVGWTEEELERYADTGEVPERFRVRAPG